MAVAVESALQTTYRLFMAENRRGHKDVVRRVRKKSIMIQADHAIQKRDWKDKEGKFLGIRLALAHELFVGRVYESERFEIGTEVSLVSKDQTCVHYYRIVECHRHWPEGHWVMYLS